MILPDEATTAAQQPATAPEAPNRSGGPTTGARNHEGTFGSRSLRYEARVEATEVPDSKGKPGATVVSFSYTALGEDPRTRPVMFAFNGGPGSASLWLHLGVLGPKRLMDSDSLTPRQVPPFRLVDNTESPLDVTDIVLIDPPGTGYSRLLDEEQAAEFYAPEPDARAILHFITTWCRTHHRELSPKFLMGESYGGTRAAAIARLAAGGPTETGHVETVAFNGIILVGPGFGTRGHPDMSYVAQLPSLAGTAYYHGRVPKTAGSVEQHMEQARAFAAGPYLQALYQGAELSPADEEDLAAQLHALIGLSTRVILDHHLRITAREFAVELLREEGQMVGLYDGRFLLPLEPRGHDVIADDPAMGRYVPGFAASFEPFVRDHFGVVRDQDDYRGLEYAAVNARWNRSPGGDGFKNYGEDLAIAMRRNQDMELMVCTGCFDLVATYGGARYALTRAPMDPSRWRIDLYESGHMLYLGKDPREKLARRMREFISRLAPS
jgi:carboxypeptidase C (cathepsin A)